MPQLNVHPETIDAIIIIANDLVKWEHSKGGDLPFGLAIIEAKQIVRTLMMKQTKTFFKEEMTIVRPQ